MEELDKKGLDWIGLDWLWSQKKHNNNNNNNSYRSEDHVQRHGNVKVESIVVDHTNSEEHGDHDPIVSGGKKEERQDSFEKFCIQKFAPAEIFLPQY